MRRPYPPRRRGIRHANYFPPVNFGFAPQLTGARGYSSRIIDPSADGRTYNIFPTHHPHTLHIAVARRSFPRESSPVTFRFPRFYIFIFSRRFRPHTHTHTHCAANTLTRNNITMNIMCIYIWRRRRDRGKVAGGDVVLHATAVDIVTVSIR